MDELFFEGRIDDRYNPTCDKVGVLKYFFLFLVTGLLAIQAVCSLLFYLFRRRNIQFTEHDVEAGVVIVVPCYDEGHDQLRKTIDSCVLTDYPEPNKVLVVIADGLITGSGEEDSTPEILAQILGFQIDFDDLLLHYRSIGKKRDNYASIYAGVYKKEVNEEMKQLKYIVIVKRGCPDEQFAPNAGNRGKRDSQLIVQGMLNRIHHNREPNQLDIGIVKALYMQGLPIKDVEYMMCIDADTRLDVTSISHLVYSMEHDNRILACCGETQVDNKAQSWVTMIQIFEYYSSYHLKKAFESVFGCVTCLPGCFTM
jgi:chitin synthase